MEKVTKNVKKRSNENKYKTAYNLLSEDEIAGIARKAARLTNDEAKLLKIPKVVRVPIGHRLLSQA